MNHPSSLVQRSPWLELAGRDFRVDVLRLDRLHPVVSGNKWFKLQHHLEQAKPGSPILTFGGAWSNHLVATAFAAKERGLPAIGIIRGERPAAPSATLEDAIAYGMQLEFISREKYRDKDQPAFQQELFHRFPGVYIIPEGGGGPAGITGCEDILRLTDTTTYTHILCAVGTGTTWQGLARAALPGQIIIGIPVLKGLDHPAAIDNGIAANPNAQLLPDYHFGGYARHPQPLLDFMNRLYAETGIPTDIVYTGKLFYAVRASIGQQRFPAHSRVLVIHSGGLQGNRSLPSGKLDF